jgi:hypothetical protein
MLLYPVMDMVFDCRIVALDIYDQLLSQDFD